MANGIVEDLLKEYDDGLDIIADYYPDVKGLFSSFRIMITAGVTIIKSWASFQTIRPI